MKKKKMIIIAGPTAVGKTEYAIRAAQEFQGEIVSADSMQLYRFMNIGSAKPTAEEQAAVRHYLVDEIDPRMPFSVADYCQKAKAAIEEIFAAGKVPFVSGGTGLYVHSLLYDMDFAETPKNEAERKRLKEFLEQNGPEALHALLQEADPEAAERIHPNNTKKVIRALETVRQGSGLRDFRKSMNITSDYTPLLIGLNRDRRELYDRINLRVDLMMEAGLEKEVHQLMEMGLDESHISMKGIGYKELIACLKGEYDLPEAVDLIKRNSRRYAKRQLTWFRRYPEMQWFDLSADSETVYLSMTDTIRRFLSED